jgi:hypothetical protein
MTIFDNTIFQRLLQVGFASVLSFGLGATAGLTTSYVTVRADAATLSARVTVEESRLAMLEQSISEWRTAEEHTSAALSQQVSDAVVILTQLRIKLGK